MNPSKTGIKRGGGEEEQHWEERGHSRDPVAALSYMDSRSWDSSSLELGHWRGSSSSWAGPGGPACSPSKLEWASSCAGPPARSPQQPWGPPDTPGPSEPTGWTQHQERWTGQRSLNPWERGPASPQPWAEVAQEGAANPRKGLVLGASPPSVESWPQLTALLCPTSRAWKHQQSPAESSHHLPFIPNGPTSKDPALSCSPHQEKLWLSLVVLPACTSTQGPDCVLPWV